MWWSEGWWVGRRCLKRGWGGGRWVAQKLRGWNPMKQENPQQHHELNEGKRKKSLQSKEGIEGSFKRDSQESLGRWGLNSGNCFGLSQKCFDRRFWAKGPEICSILNNGQFVHSDSPVLLKGTVCLHSLLQKLAPGNKVANQLLPKWGFISQVSKPET